MMALRANITETATNTVTINIESRSYHEVAPETVVFKTDLSGTSLEYTAPNPPTTYYDEARGLPHFWNFGDSYTFVAPQQNTSLGWNTSGTAIGARASHTYRAAGTYTATVSVWGYVSGVLTEATGTTSVTVADPDVLFAGANTIDLASGANLNTTISSILGQEATPKRIRLARGGTFSFSGQTFGANSGQEFPTIHIVATGSGAKPILNCTGGFYFNDHREVSANQTKDFVIQDIDARAGWDSTTGSGVQHTFVGYPQSGASTRRWHKQCLIDGCIATGFWNGVDAICPDNLVSSNHLVSLNDTSIPDYGFAGVNGSGMDRLSAVGCEIRSHVSARIRPPDSFGGYTGGYVWRTQCNMTIISKSDIFCKQGWIADGTYLGYQGVRLAPVKTVGDGQHEHYVTQSVIEAGHALIGFQTVNGDGVPLASKMQLLDSCYLVGGWQTDHPVTVNNGGLICRNNTLVYPNTTYVEHGPGYLIRLFNSTDGGAGSDANREAPILVHNNTVVNLRSNATAFSGYINDLNSGGLFTADESANNVTHQPNLSGGALIPDDPLTDSGTALFTPREVGYIDRDGNLIANMAVPATTAYTYAPETGSAAIADATTGTSADFDATGTQRPDPASRGAREVAA